jgi:hypothetical protein
MNDEKHLQVAEQEIMDRLGVLEPSRRQRVLRKIVAAALGSIPWVGGFMAAVAAFREESGQVETDSLQRQWLEEHKKSMEMLARDLAQLTARLDSLGDQIMERLESEEYLVLVRKGFRIWDQADTDLKRGYIGKLLANAAGTKVSDDDLVRLFLDWLDRYHEAHFKVVREIYQNPGRTRSDILENVHGEFPADNSPKADLFRLLVGELSLGRIIRQHREVNYQGQFIKKARKRTSNLGIMKSAFDDDEAYELTELGKQFVHYVFSEIVTRIEDERSYEQKEEQGI